MTVEVHAKKCCGSVTTEIVEDTSIKDIVRERYRRAVEEKKGCGCGCDNQETETSFVKDEYEDKEGYEPEADLGLGCGVPTEHAAIEEGDTVLDLGSGAGIDAFIARTQTGETGRVVGVDFTPEMIERARENARKLGYSNVDFIKGDIEDLPIESESIDVVLSNCVLNLVPDKKKAFAEMYRVLRVGGHFCISDIVLNAEIPERLKKSAELYAGCVSGAIKEEQYLEMLAGEGFERIAIVKDQPIEIPDSVLLEVASPDEVNKFNEDGGISSITVTGVKRRHH
jgi:arsenite methyltransferase